MWDGNYESGKMTKKYGEGKLFDGYELSQLFETLNL